MTTDEKAKAYDKALALMKDCIPDKNGYVCVRPCDIFQELKESEDEKIRKEIIEHIKSNCETGFILFQKFSPDDVIAWLEKQGEEKKQVDGFDAELNALLKKYEHLYKVDIIECLKFYANELKQRMEGEK